MYATITRRQHVNLCVWRDLATKEEFLVIKDLQGTIITSVPIKAGENVPNLLTSQIRVHDSYNSLDLITHTYKDVTLEYLAGMDL
jgi:hypothetical protein